MFNKSCRRVCLLLLALPLLGGCVAAAVTATAAGAAVAVDKRTTGTMIDDEGIELKAMNTISKNKELADSTHINVISYNNRVLVIGEAPTEEMRQQVIDIVRGIPKVTHVYDEITIAAPSSFMSRSSDTVITSKVKTRMLANGDVSGLDIKVVTEDGVVYLMGLVGRDEGDKATQIARTTGGVQKVVKLFQYTD
ncbi:MAG: BON domain-containing protein [Gammaproteobacteria bacterium]|jgi:osmotically-inducible protein OsmY